MRSRKDLDIDPEMGDPAYDTPVVEVPIRLLQPDPHSSSQLPSANGRRHEARSQDW
jgi:hypothetical protein